MTSGWNLWVWLECIGVVSGCCKDVPYFLEYTPGSLFISRHRGPGVKTRPAYKRGLCLFPSHRSRCALFHLFQLLLRRANDLQIVDL